MAESSRYPRATSGSSAKIKIRGPSTHSPMRSEGLLAKSLSLDKQKELCGLYGGELHSLISINSSLSSKRVAMACTQECTIMRKYSESTASVDIY